MEDELFLNEFIWRIDVTLVDIFITVQSELVSNGNKAVFHTFQICIPGASPSYTF